MANRYRVTAHSCVRRAVELGILPVDPWPPAPKGRRRRKVAKVRWSVVLRRLPNPNTMAAAIAAVRSQQPASRLYQVMTAVAYYGGLRPSEVVMLRPRSVHLPQEGWGQIDVVEADIDLDESGDPQTGERSVPIPQQLVVMLHSWIEDREIADDALICPLT